MSGFPEGLKLWYCESAALGMRKKALGEACYFMRVRRAHVPAGEIHSRADNGSGPFWLFKEKTLPWLGRT